LNSVSSGITLNPTTLGRSNALNIIKEGGEGISKWFNRTKYENVKWKNPTVVKERYYTNHTLKITRLPGLQNLTHKQYIEKIETLVGQRKSEIITERRSKEIGFLGEKNLTSQKACEKPRSTKTSTRESYNPLVLTSCLKTRKKIIKIYLDITELYKVASNKFRNDNKGFNFPVNTYLPPCCIAFN
jgi:hypothetical protein